MENSKVLSEKTANPFNWLEKQFFHWKMWRENLSGSFGFNSESRGNDRPVPIYFKEHGFNT